MAYRLPLSILPPISSLFLLFHAGYVLAGWAIHCQWWGVHLLYWLSWWCCCWQRQSLVLPSMPSGLVRQMFLICPYLPCTPYVLLRSALRGSHFSCIRHRFPSCIQSCGRNLTCTHALTHKHAHTQTNKHTPNMQWYSQGGAAGHPILLHVQNCVLDIKPAHLLHDKRLDFLGDLEPLPLYHHQSLLHMVHMVLQKQKKSLKALRK